MAVFTVTADQVLLSTDAIEATDTFSNGVLLSAATGAVQAVNGAGDEYANGLLMTDAGRVVFVDATAALPINTVWSNGLPRSDGAICVSSGAVAYWSNGIPFAANGAVSASFFSPASLFAAGEQGAWYDPSDFSTLFQDSAGTTPVTAVGQPVGLMRDKSGRNNHASQATAASRPVLQQDSSGNYFLLCDGVDDGMVTNFIDFTATDKMTVVAGVRKLSDVGTQVLAEFSWAASSSNLGSFGVFAPRNAGTAQYGFRLQGSAGSDTDVSSFASPITNVLSCAFDIAGATITDETIPRINGASPTRTNTGQAGTGNFGNYPLFLFRRGGTTLPFTGRFYGLIVRGAQSTAQQIAQAESWMNGKTRAY